MTENISGARSIAATDTVTTGSGAVSVLTTSTLIAAANPDRIELSIQNDHASQLVYLALGEAAVANEGIRLNAAGGGYVLTTYTGAVYGISVGGTSVVLVTEV